MEISYEIGERDVRAFNHYRLLTGPDSNRRIRMRGLILAVALALIGVTLASLSGQPYLLFVFGALAVVSQLVYARRRQWQIDKRTRAHSRQPVIVEPALRTLRTTDEGLESNTPDLRVEWGAITSIDDLGDHTFISAGPQGAVFMIPNAALAPEQLSAFLAECRARMDAARAASRPSSV